MPFVSCFFDGVQDFESGNCFVGLMQVFSFALHMSV